MRKGIVYLRGIPAGDLVEDNHVFTFRYREAYLAHPDTSSVSATLPKRAEPYESTHLFAFFEGLLPEGVQRAALCRVFHLDEQDGFGLLLKTSALGAAGAVHVEEATP